MATHLREAVCSALHEAESLRPPRRPLGARTLQSPPTSLPLPEEASSIARHDCWLPHLPGSTRGWKGRGEGIWRSDVRRLFCRWGFRGGTMGFAPPMTGWICIHVGLAIPIPHIHSTSSNQLLIPTHSGQCPLLLIPTRSGQWSWLCRYQTRGLRSSA